MATKKNPWALPGAPKTATSKQPWAQLGDPSIYLDSAPDEDQQAVQDAIAQAEPSEEDKKAALYQGLLSAGLGILAHNTGQGPAIAAIGQGGLLGMQSWQQGMQEARQKAANQFVLGSKINAALQQKRQQEDAMRQIAGLPQSVPVAGAPPQEKPFGTLTGLVETPDPSEAPPPQTRPLTYGENVQALISLAARNPNNPLIKDYVKNQVEMLEKFKPQAHVMGPNGRNMVERGPLTGTQMVARMPAENEIHNNMVVNTDQLSPGEQIYNPAHDILQRQPDGSLAINQDLLAAQIAKARAGKPEVTVVNQAETEAAKKLTAGAVDDFLERQKQARVAVAMIRQSNTILDALDNGAIAGSGAQAKYALAKFLNPKSPDVGATEKALYGTANDMLDQVKRLTGSIANKEMPHLYAAAAGNIDWSPDGLRALHREMIAANRIIIAGYQQDAARVDASDFMQKVPLRFNTIEAPPEYQKGGKQPAPTQAQPGIPAAADGGVPAPNPEAVSYVKPKARFGSADRVAEEAVAKSSAPVAYQIRDGQVVQVPPPGSASMAPKPKQPEPLKIMSESQLKGLPIGTLIRFPNGKTGYWQGK